MKSGRATISDIDSIGGSAKAGEASSAAAAGISA